LKDVTCSIILLSITILALWTFLPLNAIDLVLEVFIFIPYSFAMSLNVWLLSEDYPHR
jgi:hypothetical protein